MFVLRQVESKENVYIPPNEMNLLDDMFSFELIEDRPTNKFEETIISLIESWKDILGLFRVYSRITDNFDLLKMHIQNKTGITSPEIYKNLEYIFKDYSPGPFFRCLDTTQLLKLFLHSETKESSNIFVRNYLIQGRNFPGHIFSLIYVPCILDGKSSYVTYMFQSYYQAYMVGGNYGFYKLDTTAMNYLVVLLNKYQILENEFSTNNENRWKKQVDKYNKKFQLFTGINISKHFGDKIASRINNIIPSVKIEEYQSYRFANFFLGVKTRIKFLVRFFLTEFSKIEKDFIPKDLPPDISPDNYILFHCNLNNTNYLDWTFIGDTFEVITTDEKLSIINVHYSDVYNIDTNILEERIQMLWNINS